MMLMFSMWLLGAASSAWADPGAPVTTDVPLHLPAVLAKALPAGEVFAPNGDLWLRYSSRTLVELNVRSGKIVREVRTNLALVTAPIIGPDGDLWVGASSSHGPPVIETVSPTGKVRGYVLRARFGQLLSLGAGSDGDVWFTFEPGLYTGARSGIGRVSADGRVKTFPLPAGLANLSVGLVPARGEGFWLGAVGPKLLYAAHVSIRGPIQLTPFSFDPDVIDGSGSLWGGTSVGGIGSPDIGRLSSARSVHLVKWWTGASGASPVDGPLVLGADHQIWFTGSTASQCYSTPVGGGCAYEDTIIGTVEPNLTVMTWPIPFYDDFANGSGSLLAGPDGRLYGIGYAISGGHSWHLFAVTLPHTPTEHAAMPHIDAATVSGRHVSVKVTCTGQNGRYCAGTITAMSGAKRIAGDPYALATGLLTTRSLEIPTRSNPTAVLVTSQDAITHRTETRRVSLTS